MNDSDQSPASDATAAAVSEGSEAHGAPLLQVMDLNVHFGEVHAVRGATFSVWPGEIVGYLGPNGAGKSTTMKAVIGTVKPSRGGVLVAGVDPCEAPQEVRRLIGYLSETVALYDVLTPMELFEFVADVRGLDRQVAMERGCGVLRRLGLDEAVWRARITTFSKGMRQKTAIAATVLHEPRLLLLDEPLDGLDVSATSQFRALLNEYAASGGAVLYSSHLLDVVERTCARVIIIHHGRIVAGVRMEELTTATPPRRLEDVFFDVTGLAAEDAGLADASHPAPTNGNGPTPASPG